MKSEILSIQKIDFYNLLFQTLIAEFPLIQTTHSAAPGDIPPDAKASHQQVLTFIAQEMETRAEFLRKTFPFPENKRNAITNYDMDWHMDPLPHKHDDYLEVLQKAEGATASDFSTFEDKNYPETPCTQFPDTCFYIGKGSANSNFTQTIQNLLNARFVEVYGKPNIILDWFGANLSSWTRVDDATHRKRFSSSDQTFEVVSKKLNGDQPEDQSTSYQITIAVNGGNHHQLTVHHMPVFGSRPPILSASEIRIQYEMLKKQLAAGSGYLFLCHDKEGCSGVALLAKLIFLHEAFNLHPELPIKPKEILSWARKKLKVNIFPYRNHWVASNTIAYQLLIYHAQLLKEHPELAIPFNVSFLSKPAEVKDDHKPEVASPPPAAAAAASAAAPAALDVKYNIDLPKSKPKKPIQLPLKLLTINGLKDGDFITYDLPLPLVKQFSTLWGLLNDTSLELAARLEKFSASNKINSFVLQIVANQFIDLDNRRAPDIFGTPAEAVFRETFAQLQKYISELYTKNGLNDPFSLEETKAPAPPTLPPVSPPIIVFPSAQNTSLKEAKYATFSLNMDFKLADVIPHFEHFRTSDNFLIATLAVLLQRVINFVHLTPDILESLSKTIHAITQSTVKDPKIESFQNYCATLESNKPNYFPELMQLTLCCKNLVLFLNPDYPQKLTGLYPELEKSLDKVIKNYCNPLTAQDFMDLAKLIIAATPLNGLDKVDAVKIALHVFMRTHVNPKWDWELVVPPAPAVSAAPG